MGDVTNIAWCNHTFNPWIGCAKVSAGCKGCYAEVETFPRVQRSRGRELWGVDGERHITGEDNWAKPRRWNRAAAEAGKRARVFCASLGDVCEDRPDLVEPRGRLASLIWETPWLDWLLLTKRPENLDRLFSHLWPGAGGAWPTNVWAGTTVENKAAAAARLTHLRQVPAAVRFLSCEPLLENLGGLDLTGIGWVIAGGESGPAARPCDLAWLRGLRDQCRAAGVPSFMKQLGAKPLMEARDYHPNVLDKAPRILALRDKHGGDPAEWPEDLRVREFPRSPGRLHLGTAKDRSS